MNVSFSKDCAGILKLLLWPHWMIQPAVIPALLKIEAGADMIKKRYTPASNFYLRNHVTNCGTFFPENALYDNIYVY